MSKSDKTYPEGHFVGMWIGIGMAICAVIGIPLSIAADVPGMIGVAPAIGVSIGVAIGASIEAKYKAEGRIRPLSETEKGKKKKFMLAGVGLLILGVLVFLLLLLKN